MAVRVVSRSQSKKGGLGIADVRDLIQFKGDPIALRAFLEKCVWSATEVREVFLSAGGAPPGPRSVQPVRHGHVWNRIPERCCVADGGQEGCLGVEYTITNAKAPFF